MNAASLFDSADLPRRPHVKRMHVFDAGVDFIQFQCGHCQHNTGWVKDEWTVTQNRRGHPCPKCNAKGAAE